MIIVQPAQEEARLSDGRLEVVIDEGVKVRMAVLHCDERLPARGRSAPEFFVQTPPLEGQGDLGTAGHCPAAGLENVGVGQSVNDEVKALFGQGSGSGSVLTIGDEQFISGT